MLCINSRNSNPYYNLAAEEYLLRNTGDEVFMLWQSTPAVVVGKHQNTLAEINYRYIRDHKIRVARRLTGGGTVYHDSGNINFTFIRHGEAGRLVDFRAFVDPVIEFLHTKGVKAWHGPKHEIMVDDRKISGNAEHVFKNRVLHHGTMLFDADMDHLRQSIRHQGGVYTDKAVQSNRSSVLNLNGCIDPRMSLQNFRDTLFNYITAFFHGNLHDLQENQIVEIEQLAREKYETWDWIYGWSPDYEFRNTWKKENYDVTVDLGTHKGVITHCQVTSGSFEEIITDSINTALPGKQHRENVICEVLQHAGLRSSINDAGLFEEIMLAFF